MSAASAGVSRASMDIDGHRSETGTRQGHSKSRRNISIEAQRKTAGDAAVAFYAAQNPAINTAMTHRNIDMTNDGDGGFRPTSSIQEVVDYGDGREERVRKGIKTGERFAVTTVHQLPWGYVRPDGTTYQPRERDGTPRVDAHGEPVLLPRYEIIPEKWDEAMRYFDDCLAFDASLLPDGQAGIHGYSINLDESRPHLQVLSDTFYGVPTQKDADKMENGYSRAFGSHRSDRMVSARDFKTGKALFNPDGSPKMVREGASRKFERYHEEFKTFMVEQGHQIERERDEARHDRKLNLEDFKDLAHQQTVIDEVDLDLTITAAELDQHQAVMDDIAMRAVVVAERIKTHAELVADQIREQAEVEAGEQFERGYHRGMSKGRSEGRAVGRREGAEIVATAQQEADQIRDTAAADMEVERLRIEEDRLRIEAEQDERESRLATRERNVIVVNERVAELAAQTRTAKERADAEAAALTAARERVEAGAAAWDELDLADMNHYSLRYLEETRLKSGGTLLDRVKEGGKKKFLAEHPAADPATAPEAKMTRQQVAEQYERGESAAREAKGHRQSAAQRQTDQASQTRKSGQTPNY